MKGKICMVTGANSGVGKITAETLARQGATVIMICRSPERGAAARDEIVASTGSDAIELMIADVGSRQDLERVAADFKRAHDRLDVLVNNAGVYLSERSTTVDGFESMFGINHLGYYIGTLLLLDVLEASGDARVVNVSSEGHRGGQIDFNDLQAERAFNGLRQYCNTKLANVLFTAALARRLEGRGVTANSLHPGAIRSGFGQTSSGAFGALLKLSRPFLSSPERGARTQIFLATAPEIAGVTGQYFIRSKARRASRVARDPALAESLWRASAELTGLDI